MLPNVVFVVNRNGLGLVEFTKDGIMGFIVSGVTAGSVTVGVPFSINQLSDAVALGVTGSVNAALYKQIEEFYAEAGNGVKSWWIVSDEELMSTNITGATNACRSLVEAAKGEICIVGLCRGTDQSGTIVDGLDEDVWDAIPLVQSICDEYQGKIMPFSIVIDGVGFSGGSATLATLKTMTKNRASVLLCAKKSDGVASIGQFLAREAVNPVQRKPSRVKSGALTNTEAYLTDGELVDGRDALVGELHDKGFIVYREFPTKSGYYFSGDPTACAATDDLNTIARNRIIDKAIKIAYSTYVEELDDDVEVTEAGLLDPALVTYLQQKIITQATANFQGEISNFRCVIDANQNILSGVPFVIGLGITPKGYLSEITINIGFENPYTV